MRTSLRSIAAGLTIGLGFALGVGLLACGSDAGSQWRDLPASEALARLQGADPPLFLDVRTSAEYREGHIPGAINIPHDEIAERIDEIRASGRREIVVFCERGGRARMASEVLKGQGLGELRHLVGDMSGWRELGYPLVRTGGARQAPERSPSGSGGGETDGAPGQR